MTDNNSLENYIRNEFQSIANNNACDHRPTSQSELDREEERIRKLYERGLVVLEEIGQEDLNRCLRLYTLNHNYGDYDLVEVRILEQWVIVPRYVKLVEKMREIREAIL